MNIKLAFLLPKLLLLTKSAILVFLLSMMQPQHGFSSIEGEETEKNNPPGFKSIQKFDSDGTFITEWGSEGSAEGQFNKPSDIAIDSSGNVYVADWGNARIQVFASSLQS